MDDLDPIVVAYVVRHGTTVLNREKKFRGDRNIPLDEKGKKDAEEIGEFLKDKTFGSVFSSDLDRARKTAQIAIGSETPVEVTSALRPLNVGDLAGKKKADHLKEVQAIQKDHNLKLPGSDESINDFDKRIRTHSLARRNRDAPRVSRSARN